MVFIALAIIAIILYVLEYKTTTLVIFFFFLTSGFYFIPSEILEIGPISKGGDYAFFILFGLLTIDIIFVNKYLRPDNYTKYFILFFIFLCSCILYNKFILGLSISEIFRTCRYLFFWMSYFVFRNLSKKNLENLLRYLFIVAIVCCIFYILQILLGKNILVNDHQSITFFLGFKILRFYNQPDILPFFLFLGIYCNPYKGLIKKITTIILIIAFLGAFHRSGIGMFIVTILIGYILKLPLIKQIRITIGSLIILLFFLIFASHKIVSSQTFMDLKFVFTEDIAEHEFDMNDLDGATFAFRIAHLLERNEYIKETPLRMLFGGGLFPEDSKKVEKMFDFQIGLLEELTGETIQLDTGDISYSVLILRYGYLGAVLNLLLYIYLMISFYKKRKNKYAFSSFLFFILSFGVSFFSANLINPVTIILPLITYNIVKKQEECESYYLKDN